LGRKAKVWGPALPRDAIRCTLVIIEQAGIRAMLKHPIHDYVRSFIKSSVLRLHRLGRISCWFFKGCETLGINLFSGNNRL
jgi:hypothetical protein